LVEGTADDTAGQLVVGEPGDVVQGGDAAGGDDGQLHGGGQFGGGRDVGPREHAVLADIGVDQGGERPGGTLPGQVQGRAAGHVDPAVGGDQPLAGVD